MSSDGITEAITVLANGFDRVISGLKYVPDQLRLDCFEYGFHHRITRISAPPVKALDQSPLRLLDRNGLVQSTDRQILLHPIPRFPADDATRIKLDNDCQIQPALTGPED